MLDINKIYQGDCLELMQSIDDNSIDLTVTSPPYDNLRTYNGFTFDFENIAKELFRVTKNGGVVVWVVADATINGSETGTSFKQALFFKDVGFNVHDTMIYGKNNFVPLTHNRYEQQFEYMFIFSKGKPKTFNAIRIPTICIGEKRSSKSTFRQTGTETKPLHSFREFYNDNKISPNIFFYNTNAVVKGHPAIFPEKLAEDHIISWSNENDIVFDPMCGSGTTCKMALKNNRNFIGIDISQEYVDIANKRIQDFKQQLVLM